MKRLTSNFLIIIALALIAFPAAGATFFNGDFESPGTFNGEATYLGSGSTYVTGWFHSGIADGEFYTDGAAWGITAGQGTFYVGFGAFGVTGGSMSQTFDTTPGQSYAVNYLLSTQELDGVLPDQVAFVSALDDGDNLLDSVSNTINTPAGVWVNGLQLQFVATSSSTTLRFTDLTLFENGGTVNWGLDNVSLTAMPEPASYALIGLGLGVIALRKRLFRP